MEKFKRVISPPLDKLDQLRQPLTEGEKIVLDFFLENLTNDWEIYIQPHLNGLRPDFVLLSPIKGLAVYEVKDWNLSALHYFYKERPIGQPQLFASNGDKTFSMKKNDPFLKAKIYRDEIYNLYCPSLPDKSGFGLIIGGVIFPFATQTQVEKLASPLWNYKDLKEYKKWTPIVSGETLNSFHLKKVLNFVYRKDDRMNERIANDFRHWLVEPEFSNEQRRPLLNDMDARQKDLVDTRTSSGYRRIRGAAGSGKSLVLAGRAARLASEGKNVLLITFNITLINYLLDLAVRFEMNGKVRSQITSLNFHFWCKRMAYITGNIEEYDQLWTNSDYEEILKNDLPKKVIEWTKELQEQEKFDAILVDEGQDFELIWWTALREVLKTNGEMLLCADRTQNVYGVIPWTELAMEKAGFRGDWMNLDNSYRLPPSLCKLASKYIEIYLPKSENIRPVLTQEEIDFHTELKWTQINSSNIVNGCVDALIDIVQNSSPSISYSDLTCIVETAQIGLLIVEELKLKNIICIHTFGNDKKESRRKKLTFYKGDARVKITTIHSFKGWESKAIVLQISNAKTEEALSLIYSGLTRLKRVEQGCYLTVICSEALLESYGKSWPIFKNGNS